jgi:hypothetical protein
MLITVEFNGQYLSLPAPLGAAAYLVTTTDATASVLFAMMKQGETGIDTLNRVLDDGNNHPWLPCAARPEEQTAMSARDKSDFLSYDFTLADGVWTTSTIELAEFMAMMQSMTYLPTSAPASLATTLEAFMGRGSKTKVTARKT